jgi:hypothetical protein
MTKRLCVTIAALLGAALPIIFLSVLYYIHAHQDSDVSSAAGVERLMLLLWPSSLMQMAIDGARPNDPGMYIITVSSIAINAILYALIGLCGWLGFKKNSAYFVIPTVILLMIWWKLFSFA